MSEISADISFLTKNRIKTLTASFNDYELEVFLTDIYCFNKCLNEDIEFENIIITPPVADKGIDALLIYKKCGNMNLNILQISSNPKSKRDQEKFYNSNLQYYKYFINEYNIDYLEKTLITSKKSPRTIMDTNYYYLDGNELIILIYETFIRLGLWDDDYKLDTYVKNIRVRSELWKLINIHFKQIVKYEKSLIKANTRRIGNLQAEKLECEQVMIDHLNAIKHNFTCMLKSDFKMILTLDAVSGYRTNGVLDEIPGFGNNEKELVILLSKVKAYNNKVYNKYRQDIKNLLIFLIEFKSKYNYNFEIVPTQEYLSIKRKDNLEVIAYFHYKFANYSAKGFTFAFKCKLKQEMQTIDSNANLVEHFKDNASFKTNTYLLHPNLVTHKKLISHLIDSSYKSISPL